jgi:cytochrome c biogenesis protein CcmG/thiol:disulfide interchange protein DsbE
MTRTPANLGLWFLVFGLFAGAGLRWLRDYAAFRHEAALNPVGKAAPDAPVTTLDGRPLRLSSFAGRPLWLNFFATWCPPCKAEQPSIEALYRRFRSQRLEVVGIDQDETPRLVAPYLQRYAISYPVVIDEGPAAAAYNVFDLPTSVFIDSRGVVRALKIGQMSPQEMSADLKHILP